MLNYTKSLNEMGFIQLQRETSETLFQVMIDELHDECPEYRDIVNVLEALRENLRQLGSTVCEVSETSHLSSHAKAEP